MGNSGERPVKVEITQADGGAIDLNELNAALEKRGADVTLDEAGKKATARTIIAMADIVKGKAEAAGYVATVTDDLQG